MLMLMSLNTDHLLDFIILVRGRTDDIRHLKAVVSSKSSVTTIAGALTSPIQEGNRKSRTIIIRILYGPLGVAVFFLVLPECIRSHD
jgi:hypothetical protein